MWLCLRWRWSATWSIRWPHDRRCSRDRWRSDERRACGMTHGLEGDPGAQPQRTILSWHRTVLAVTVGALVASMTAQRLGHPRSEERRVGREGRPRWE